MPIYEYECNQCGKTFDFFHRTQSDSETVRCPECGASNVQRLLSTFSTSSEGKTQKGGSNCPTGQCPLA